MPTTKNVNKVVYDGKTLIDLTSDTVAAGNLLSGETAHDASGTVVTGTIPRKSSTDVTVSAASVTTPAGYYNEAVTKSVAMGTAGTPVATKGTVTNHSISISPSVENVTGYISGGTKTGTSVTVTAADLVSGSETKTKNATYDVTNLAELVVNVPASEVVSGTKYITDLNANDVTTYKYAQVSDADIVAANIRDGVNILGVAGTFTDAETVSTGQTAAAAANILTTKSAWVDGAEVKGSMPNNGAVTPTISTQGGTYTIPAGYHNGSGKVTAQLPVSVLDNTIISGESFLEATGDYGWKSTVAIPTGYHEAQTLEKTFSSVFPAPETPGTSADVRQGKQFYDKDGKVITGTIPDQAATTFTASLTDQTIAAGKYTAGIQTIKAVSLDVSAANMLSDTTASIVSNESVVTSVTGTIARKSSADLTVSGATVTAPVGYYGTAASATVASGTQGTPTATKGTVVDHAITVTPSVTNTTGYIVGATKTGEAATVTAAELVSGNLACNSAVSKQTDIDVTNYATVSIEAMEVEDAGATPKTYQQVLTPSTGKLLRSATIAAIPYKETENAQGGLTVEIAY